MSVGRSQSNIERDKLEIIKWVTGLKDETSIERLKLLKDKKRVDWWDEITESEKAAIEEGIKDMKSGKTKSQKEVKQLYEKWL
jgi:hypothetical protein